MTSDIVSNAGRITFTGWPKKETPIMTGTIMPYLFLSKNRNRVAKNGEYAMMDKESAID